MKGKKFLIELIFWLHLPFFAVWFALFLVPKSVWSWKVVFHFWYIIALFVVQLLWALLIWRKLDILCPLTTWMQWLRGHPVKSKKNYAHSYIAELLQRLHIKMTHKTVKVIFLFSLVLVTVQYIWFR